ncbi:protein-export chaperone SecB [Aliiroseovarius sp. F47248L]|uniref:protein-export chaperone SecB n=1 Tax=Aliiroseovarius sp. F47248L TaxID=2926420 RepID=UPI001FF3DFFA|nr:protein-export chaperone SecB [Aliiroseovarius sp. F47248L]MCK0140175.1 protein-export chaperone SecB [Aliiroseovarius sp. F47248L]
MAEEAKAQTAPVQPKMQVLGQFIRDMSFENILAQKGVQGEVQPDINVEVALDAKKRPTDNQFEVISKYTIGSKNKNGGEQLFLMELEYAGIFQVENVPEDQMHPFLMIECPRMLFPFVRRIVADVTRDGGFPSLNLDTVDFLALYRHEIERRVAAEQGDAKVN